MIRDIKRRFNAVALVCLPALILILSAAPSGCPGPCGDELSAPSAGVVVSLP